MSEGGRAAAPLRKDRDRRRRVAVDAGRETVGEIDLRRSTVATQLAVVGRSVASRSRCGSSVGGFSVLGTNCRSRPLVCSLRPRSQERDARDWAYIVVQSIGEMPAENLIVCFEVKPKTQTKILEAQVGALDSKPQQILMWGAVAVGVTSIIVRCWG